MSFDLTKFLPGVRKNVPLAPYTTFKIGGEAAYFFTARTAKSIIQAVGVAKRLRIPFFILGGGSNLVVSDKGFPGLVIYIKTKKYRIEDEKLFCEAGVPMPTLVKETGKKGLSGLGSGGR